MGRPRRRWLEEVEVYLGRLGIRNWKRLAAERSEWRRIVLEVKVHEQGCSALEEKEEENVTYIQFNTT